MATRRIARGRGASPVPIIVLSVLLVGLLASTIVLALQISKAEVEKDNALAKTRAADLVHAQDVQGLLSFARIVGLKDAAARDQLEALKKEISEKAPIRKLGTDEEVKATGPFEDLVTVLKAYVERTAVLEFNEAYLKQELEKSKTERGRLEQEVKAKEGEGQTAVTAEKKRVEELDGAKAKLEADLAQVRKELGAQIDVGKNDKVDAAKDISSAKKDAKVWQDKFRDLKRRYEEITKAKDMRELIPTAAGPGVCGRVVTIDADGQHVMIDLGRQDWVEVGMKFAVFDQADPDARKQKGEVQVRRVFDVISQAKVLKQDPLDPILPGMYVVQPAFSRGRTLEFVFEGKLKDPNLPRALQRYPCRIAKEVTEKTDYLVLGEGERKSTDPNPEDSRNKQLADTKYKNTCFVMKERDLARYLGESD